MDAKTYPSLRETKTWSEMALRPVSVHVWFETDGANNPTVFSPGIESVTRRTADTSSQVFYRVRLSKITRQAAQTGSAAYRASASMVRVSAGDALLPMVANGFLVTGTAAEANREIDVTVRDVIGGAFTNSIAAGRRIAIDIHEDALGGRRRGQ